jgi:hypothetical protein
MVTLIEPQRQLPVTMSVLISNKCGRKRLGEAMGVVGESAE